MTDNPVPVPKAPLPDRLLTAAQRAFPNHDFEVNDGDTIELYVLVTVVDGEPGRGEITPADVAELDAAAAAGDEYLFQIVRHTGDQLEGVYTAPSTLTTLGLDEDAIRVFVESFE